MRQGLQEREARRGADVGDGGDGDDKLRDGATQSTTTMMASKCVLAFFSRRSLVVPRRMKHSSCLYRLLW